MSSECQDNCTVTNCRNATVSKANDSLVIFEERETPSENFKLTLQVLMGLFGVIGNVLVIIVIHRLGKRKKRADFYAQHLAIADLGMLLFIFPLAVIKEKAPYDWPFGEFTCLYLYPVPEIFYGASVWCIAVIAIERYRKIFTVKTPGRNKNKPLFQRPKTLAVCVWVTSFLVFCFPVYFTVGYRNAPNGGKWCGPVWTSWGNELVLAYIVLLTLFSYIFPLTVISFTYLRISRVINRSSLFIKAMRREQSTTENKERISLPNIKITRLKQNKRAKKILTPLVLVFAITMLPLNIFRLVIVFWPAFAEQPYYKNLLYAVSVLAILNSSVNPVIYSIVSRDFRKGINNLCCPR